MAEERQERRRQKAAARPGGQRQFYPSYHLAAPQGWLNDPNGLIYYRGQYHAFYQHYPHKAEWGPMHWGHAVSADMVHWRHLPPALSPGPGPDKDGCFSGSAIAADGRLCLIYTGNVWLGPANAKGERPLRQVQCLATSEDGRHFTKQGAVLAPPPGISHFRDPKIWRQDGIYYLVLGVSDSTRRGQVWLYRSADLRRWQFERILAQSAGDLGYMWECPDFFPLGGRHILSFSPQGMQKHRGYGCRNLFQCGYMTGSWQPGQAFTPAAPFAELDSGHDYYAAQSFTAADGRRIMLAWLDMWETPRPAAAEGWAGCFTLPRALELDAAGRLRQRPIAELQKLRGPRQAVAAAELNNQAAQLAANITAAEIMLRWNRRKARAERYGLRLGRGLSIYLDTQSGRLTLERFYPAAGLCGSRSAALELSDELELHIFLDNSSAEVFANNGEAVLSSRIYPPGNDRAAFIFADAGAAQLLSGEFWPLKSIWTETAAAETAE